MKFIFIIIVILLLTAGAGYGSIWLLGGIMVRRIKKGYEEEFSVQQKNLRNQILAVASPGKIFRGRVIGRT